MEGNAPENHGALRLGFMAGLELGLHGGQILLIEVEDQAQTHKLHHGAEQVERQYMLFFLRLFGTWSTCVRLSCRRKTFLHLIETAPFYILQILEFSLKKE